MTIIINIPKKIEMILNLRANDEHIYEVSVLKQMLKGERDHILWTSIPTAGSVRKDWQKCWSLKSIMSDPAAVMRGSTEELK